MNLFVKLFLCYVKRLVVHLNGTSDKMREKYFIELIELSHAVLEIEKIPIV